MRKQLYIYFLILSVILMGCANNQEHTSKQGQPNIIYILADDLGYGDVSVYNPSEKITTPNIDRLAESGIRFTDAHSPSSVCTPTRYSILTGQYPWRSRLPKSVLSGYGRALIEQDQQTVASMLKEQGYSTAVIGKWHLGLDWVVKEGREAALEIPVDNPNGAKILTTMNPDDIDFSKPPTDGPLKHGFDYSYILPASLDMEPYCYLKNDTLVELPTGHTEGNDLNTGYTGAFWRAGLMAPGFDMRQVLPTFTSQAENYIRNQKNTEKPYFLYFAMTAPHTPWLPAKDFEGSSQAGDYGDFVTMVDAMVGRVLTALKESGKEENTIVFLASDNGPFWRPAFVEKYDHRAAYIYRGMKADAWDGGHRIPFMVRWPGHIQPGSVSNATTTLANLLATVADITGVNQVKGEDSYSILPVLLGKTDKVPGQDAVVHHSSKGLFAIRYGDWKLIEGRGSGGFSEPVFYDPKPGEAPGQLFNIKDDPSETFDLYQQKTEIVKQLTIKLDSIKHLKSVNDL
ncbi:MAG: arylsulfatase [Draconibacterium sp.]